MSNDATGRDSSLNITILSSEPADTSALMSVNTSSVLDTAVRLKLIRDAAGFSQRELAKRAGVTNSSISMIEQAQVSPSIQSLTRILTAFPISLADFYSFRLSDDIYPARIGGSDKPGLMRDQQQLEARTELLLAGQSTAFSALAVDSCGVVLNGSLQLTLLDQHQLLNQGESFYIPARRLFRLINLSRDDARLFRCSLFVHKP
jgi:transcriptional regulator with XRE-family HTH domain